MLAFLIPQLLAWDKIQTLFGNGNRAISHPGCLGWLHPSEVAAVSVPLSKGKAGDGDLGAALP